MAESISPDEPNWREGVVEFNRGNYFEAHELWEKIWHDTSGDERHILQALIQVAAANNHISLDNEGGAGYLLSRAYSRIKNGPEKIGGVSLEPVRTYLEEQITRERKGAALRVMTAKLSFE